MTTTLTKPWKVNQRAECIYAYAPGEVCIDLTSGTPEDRARVMALLKQVQRMGRVLLADMARGDDGLMHDEFRCPYLSAGECADWCKAKRDVLRAAGVLDE